MLPLVSTPSTSELFELRAVGGYSEGMAVDWALGQIADHDATPNLASLAGLIPPFNYFVVEDLLRRALDELGETEPPTSVSRARHLRRRADAIIDGAVSPEGGCRYLAGLNGGNPEMRDTFPFWLLIAALEDLGSNGWSYYYREATVDNFDALVVREARALVARLEQTTAG